MLGCCLLWMTYNEGDVRVDYVYLLSHLVKNEWMKRMGVNANECKLGLL